MPNSAPRTANNTYYVKEGMMQRMTLDAALHAYSRYYETRQHQYGAVPHDGTVTQPVPSCGAIFCVEYRLVREDGRGVIGAGEAWAVIAAGNSVNLIGKAFADMSYVGDGRFRFELARPDDELPGNMVDTNVYANVRHELRGLAADVATVAIDEWRLVAIVPPSRW